MQPRGREKESERERERESERERERGRGRGRGFLEDPTSRLLLSVQTTLVSRPSGQEPCPSIGYIAAEWFSARVSKQGVEEVYRGNLDRLDSRALVKSILVSTKNLTSTLDTFLFPFSFHFLNRPTPGSLAELIVLLALLDFLTATPSTGFGSTASRIVTLKAGCRHCAALLQC